MRAFPVGEYIVLYRAEGDDVLIQRVVRGSRDLETLLGD
jgi:plasmid stabilization system protein ParE